MKVNLQLPQSPVLPLFIVDKQSGDMTVYTSLLDLKTHLEPLDVRSGAFVGWDASGRLLRIEMTSSDVEVRLAELSPQHQMDLESAIKAFLVAVGAGSGSPQEASLPTLVARAEAFAWRASGLPKFLRRRPSRKKV